jgi:ketosteroid isomerase-like protein
MSQENVEIVLQGIDAVNRQDPEAFVATASPDIEWEDSAFWSESPRIYRGRSELREWFHQVVVQPWESIHGEAEEIREASDGRIFAGGVMTVRGKGSHAEVRQRGWFVFWVANGTITKRRVFLDRNEALEAAGLRE